MATYKRSEVVNNSFNAPLPKASYILRVLKAELTVSKSSGNPMTTLEAEIICRGDGATVVECMGQKVNAAGRKTTYYIPYTEKSQTQVFEFYDKMGIHLDELDPENPPSPELLKSLTFEAILSAEPDIPRMAPRPGQAVGDPIKDSNGKEIIRGYRISNNLGDILGLSSVPEAHSKTAPY